MMSKSDRREKTGNVRARQLNKAEVELTDASVIVENTFFTFFLLFFTKRL
jgi:hypothetical protein